MKTAALIAFVLTLAGNLLCFLIWLQSIKPERGANMILMAMPLVALPTVFVALSGAILAGLNPFKKSIRIPLICFNAASLAWFLVLFVAG